MKNIYISTLIVFLISSTIINAQNNPSPFSIYNSLKVKIMQLDQQANVIVFDQIVGTLHKNGLLTNTDNDTIAYLNSDNYLISNNKVIAKILENGTIEMNPAESLKWSKDGKLTLSPTEFLSVEPSNNKNYRNASILFIAYSTLNESTVSNIEIIENEEILSNDFPPITQIVFASVESGNYGGSTANKIFPSNYTYAKYEWNEDVDDGFMQTVNNYLNNSKVNDTITLAEYLKLLKDNNVPTLDKIHSTNQITHPKGNKQLQLPILIFTQYHQVPTFSINPSIITISGSGATEMHEFMKKHAEHFSNEIPDSFFNSHYPNVH